MKGTPEDRWLDEQEAAARAELVRGVLRLGDGAARALGVPETVRGSEAVRTALETIGVVLGHDAVLAGMEERLGLPGSPAAALGHVLRRSEQYASMVAVADRVLRDLRVPADAQAEKPGGDGRAAADGWGD